MRKNLIQILQKPSNEKIAKTVLGHVTNLKIPQISVFCFFQPSAYSRRGTNHGAGYVVMTTI